MEIIYAIILGLVQGIAEFLPISSSGHLVIAAALLRQLTDGGLPEIFAGLTMEIALHAGTLMSIVVVYFRELLALTRQRERLFRIVMASIPVACVGVFLRDMMEPVFDNALMAGCCLLFTAVVLLLTRRCQRAAGKEDSGESLTMGRAMVIGAMQAVAILPGISRAGMTISGGLLCGLSGRESASFSFQLALPAVGGAALLEVISLMQQETSVAEELLPLLVGAAVSFLTGLLALRWLLALLAQGRMHRFSAYCGAVGLLTIVWQLLSD